MAIVLPIEKNPELLQKYGLAMALLSTGDYLLGEMVRLIGGLHKANQDLANELMGRKTFGAKIELAKRIGVRPELERLFQPAVEDRNRLAHGITVEGQDEALQLMHGANLHDINADSLDGVIERARNLCSEIVREIQLKFSLTQSSSGGLRIGEDRR